MSSLQLSTNNSSKKARLRYFRIFPFSETFPFLNYRKFPYISRRNYPTLNKFWYVRTRSLISWSPIVGKLLYVSIVWARTPMERSYRSSRWTKRAIKYCLCIFLRISPWTMISSAKIILLSTHWRRSHWRRFWRIILTVWSCTAWIGIRIDIILMIFNQLRVRYVRSTKPCIHFLIARNYTSSHWKV